MKKMRQIHYIVSLVCILKKKNQNFCIRKKKNQNNIIQDVLRLIKSIKINLLQSLNKKKKSANKFLKILRAQ